MKIIKDRETNNIMALLTELENVDDKVLKANDVDASFEKHVPQFEEFGDKVKIYVNHVMEEDHYIEWIMVDYKDMQIIKEFKPKDIPEIIVDKSDEIVAYSYCNKHSLWKNSIKGE